jgi:hypothetical protein
MRGLVLDENIYQVIASQVSNRRPDIHIQSIFHWRTGTLRTKSDPIVLQAAMEDGLTLVTYDVNTILPLVTAWGVSGLPHAGVVFVYQRTIRSNDFSGPVRALERLWDREHDQDWTNRTDFLGRL